ncbi:tripartite motif-containing protein 59-like [Palaemon carinicauda]|uniref:tripartite motif-containing protein 59-like n=1 Tax=Palaemon carinicauda TaxID=392227 RepID=UPI0035B58941
MNIDEEEPNCNICFEPYDDDEHSPRTLRCGHTLCTPCIEMLVKKSLPDRVCPECRKSLKISNASHLPISYTILRLSRALAKSKTGTEVQVQVLDSNTCMVHGAPTISWCPLSDKWHCFKCVHKDDCSNLLSVPEAFLHIKQNHTQAVESKLTEATNMTEALKKEKETLRKEIIASERRIAEIEERLEKISEWTSQLESDEATLVEAATMVRVTKSLGRLKRDIANFDAWLERSKPSVKSKRTPMVVLSQPVDIEGLRKQLHITQALYAVHESESFDKRYARLWLDDGRLLMGTLSDLPPPNGTLMVPFEMINGAVERTRPQAFFDITCEDVYQGRVYFSLYGMTPRAKRFLKLCTGETGASYKYSRLMEFEEDNHRFVRGGMVGEGVEDFDPIVDDITDRGFYQKKLEAGLLTGWKSGDEQWALFDVVLECKPGFEDDYTFGKVLHGLNLLKGICEYSQNKKVVEIQDCGIVVNAL